MRTLHFWAFVVVSCILGWRINQLEERITALEKIVSQRQGG